MKIETKPKTKFYLADMQKLYSTNMTVTIMIVILNNIGTQYYCYLSLENDLKISACIKYCFHNKDIILSI